MFALLLLSGLGLAAAAALVSGSSSSAGDFATIPGDPSSGEPEREQIVRSDTVSESITLPKNEEGGSPHVELERWSQWLPVPEGAGVLELVACYVIRIDNRPFRDRWRFHGGKVPNELTGSSPIRLRLIARWRATYAAGKVAALKYQGDTAGRTFQGSGGLCDGPADNWPKMSGRMGSYKFGYRRFRGTGFDDHPGPTVEAERNGARDAVRVGATFQSVIGWYDSQDRPRFVSTDGDLTVRAVFVPG